jgi:hypothetical protein
MMAERTTMRRATGAPLVLALALGACGPDWQPSWNMSSTPAPPGDSLTIQRVTTGEAEFTPLRSESTEQLRLSAGLLASSRPTSPEAAMTAVPPFNPMPRPDVDAVTAPAAPPPAPRPRAGSSTSPLILSPAPEPERARVSPPLPPVAPPRPPAPATSRTVVVPGEPPGTVTGTGRVQTYTQPGNPAGGVAIQDGGTTTIIQPGGRVTTVPTPR